MSEKTSQEFEILEGDIAKCWEFREQDTYLDIHEAALEKVLPRIPRGSSVFCSFSKRSKVLRNKVIENCEW